MAVVCGPAAAGTGVVDVSLTPTYSETEQYACADPLDARNLIVGSNQWQPVPSGSTAGYPVMAPSGDGVVDTAVWSSRDGGRSWAGGRLAQGGAGTVKLPLPANPFLPPELSDVGNVIEADQSCAFDRHGDAYYESGDFYSAANPGDVVLRVWRSSDAGRTWGAPVAAASQSETGNLLDRPFVTVDDSGGARDGTVYLTYESSFYQDVLNAVYVVSSRDRGRTWSRPVRVDEPSGGTQADPRQAPAVDRSGALYVVYDVAPEQGQGGPQVEPIKLVVARSADGGRTFSHTLVEADAHRMSDPDEAEPYFTELISAIAADPRRPGRVAVAWPEATSGSSSRVLLRYTSDGGAHWSGRLDVADDPAARANEHDHVALSYLPDGRLAVAWRDRRCCGGGFSDPYRVYARILDVGRGGRLSPGPALTVSAAPSASSASGRGNAPDEYVGVAAVAGGLLVAWDELRGSLPDDVARVVAVPAAGRRHVRHRRHRRRHRHVTHRHRRGREDGP